MDYKGFWKFHSANVTVEGVSVTVTPDNLEILVKDEFDRHMVNQLTNWKLYLHEDGKIYLGMLKSALDADKLKEAEGDGSLFIGEHVYGYVNDYTEKDGELFAESADGKLTQITAEGLIDMGVAVFEKEEE